LTVALQRDDGGTVLTLTHEQLFDEAARNGHLSGWGEAFDKLEACLARHRTWNRSVMSRDLRLAAVPRRVLNFYARSAAMTAAGR
jgi:Activator of Hsp90 ATPase homolog 1-like protein